MLTTENRTIYCSRGDSGTITLKLPYLDSNGYVMYLDISENIYWYDADNDVLYDSDYNESQVSLSSLTQEFYEFKPNDVITFNIYEKKGFDKPPLLSKNITIDTSSDEATISLTENDTTFGEIPNKEIEYWYDITLNNSQTVIGYDKSGAKLFIMYPAKGAGENE